MNSIVKFSADAAITLKASADIKEGQCLKLHTDGTVQPAGAGTAFFGVAGGTAKDGSHVLVYRQAGVLRMIASAAIANAGPVKTAANGEIATSTGPSEAGFIGYALKPAGKKGDVVPVDVRA